MRSFSARSRSPGRSSPLPPRLLSASPTTKRCCDTPWRRRCCRHRWMRPQPGRERRKSSRERSKRPKRPSCHPLPSCTRTSQHRHRVHRVPTRFMMRLLRDWRRDGSRMRLLVPTDAPQRSRQLQRHAQHDVVARHRHRSCALSQSAQTMRHKLALVYIYRKFHWK